MTVGPDSARSSQPVRRQAVKSAAIAVTAWLGLWGFILLSEGRVQPALLAAVVAGATAVGWVAVWLAPVTTPIDWTPAYVSGPSRAGHDPRFSRLSRLLSEATERVTVGDEVHRTLRSLAAERLERLHDVHLESDQERSRQLLGDELYDYVTQPTRRLRGNEAAALSRLLSRIEAL